MAYRVLNSGQISSVTDPTGVVTRLSYDARGNLTGVLNAVGDMLKVEYDAQDRPVSVVSPSGGTMRVEYDAASRPVRVIDPAGNATVYTYTPAGKVASITDAVGGVRRLEYNAAGELVAQVAPDGARTVREINELGYTVAETDPLGHVTKFVHDGMGRVTEKIDPAGNVWASRYNAADTLVEHTDPTGVLTRVSRDSAAGEITHQDGVGNTATVGFDALGRVMSSIDPSGAVTSWAYQFLTNTTTASSGEGDRGAAHRQGASEPVRVQDPTENLVSVPGAHALRTCTDAAGQVSGEVCDAAGRVLRQVSASGAVTEYSYDACGRVASVTDADGVMTEYRYDADSRLVAKTRAGVVVESFVYDACGRLLERRAGTKLVGRYAYDAAGRVVRCVDAAWGTRSFSYDACGRVVKAVSGVGGTCFFDYDGAGRLLARRVATSEGFATTSYAYDAVGNVVSVTDPFGAVTKYAYDGAHRCTEVMNPDGSRVSYAYDGAGEVASMHVAKPGERLGRLACEWVRDRAGRCLTVKDYLAGENLARLGAQRSAAATVATATTTVGSANASATTAAGRSSIGFSDGVESEADVHVQTTYVSDALGRLVRVDSAPKLGDEVSDTAFFAAGNRVSAAENASAAEVFASTGAWSLAYSYDADGNVVQRTTPYGSTVYGYSPGGRIRSTQQIPAGVGVEDSSSVGDKPGVAEFAYDALGYLERVQVGECVSSWVRDTSGAVMGYTEEVLGGANEPGGSSSGVVQGVRVRRNPAGKITRVEDTVKGSWCEYAYDASGRLIRAVSSDDVSVAWVYDPVGLLMREETHQEGALVRVRSFSYAGERVQTVRLHEALEDGVSSAAPFAGVVEDLTGLDTSSLVCTGSIQYSYDVRGFRTGAADHTGAAVTWGWDALGSLERVERINHNSDSPLGSHLSAASDGNSTVWFAASSVRNMPVAVGSQQDGQDPVVSPLVWDTTVPDAALLVGVGVTEAVSAGSVLGGRDSILTGTGAGVYSFGTDIFGTASPVTWGSNTTAAAGNGLPGLPADVGLTVQGALATVGGELMGARLYDPVTAGFLSPDPVEPVAGSGYMGASYLFASGDPVNLHDPTGLEPIPVEVMTEYIRRVKNGDVQRDALNKFWEDVKHKWNRFWSSSIDDWNKFWEDFLKDPVGWINSHPEELRNGAVMILSVMMLGTPLSPFAVGYLGGVGTSWIIQRWENGKIDPRQLQIDGLIGAGSEALFMLIGRVYRVVRSGKGVEFNTSGGRLSIPGQAPSSMAKFDTRLVGAAESKILQAGESGFYTRLKPGDAGYGILKSPARELQETRYPKIEVKPVTGGASSATEVPPVAVSRVDVPQVAPVEGSGASRGASQVPVKPVEAPQVGEVPPASGAGSGAAGMQAVKPGGVADDAVAARGSAGVREPEVQLKPVEEPKVENLPPAKGVEGDSNPVTADRHVSWTEHPPGSTVQNGDKTITYLDAADFKSALATGTKDSSRYVRVEEPGTYNVYGFDEARLVRDDYYKKLKGQDSPADLSKGEPKFALWRPEVGEPNLDTAMTGFRDVTRHGNTVEAQVGNHKFMVTNLDEYTGTIPDDVVPTAKSIYEDGEVYWKNKDHKPEGFGNVPDPLPFDNKDARILPTHDQVGNEIKYTEYKVRRLFRTPNQVNDAGIERLVVGSDGSIYFTPDHYETFVRII
ncbi:RHS repeat-associated core domain-containing protein [Rothia sp. HMSC065G12]|uniref:RHS repeat-associated core domain-containing protein n=1 Tax=Rothia sp. HMSC065G12 TaxID=1739308 RepID=UPI001439D87A|nr:RHS repeat-associated core domain-containing protein [Rothia sp. HMSC065G12]